MKKLILFLLGTLYLSCSDLNPDDVQFITKNMVFFKEPKTGLCFAAVYYKPTGASSNSITCVPCKQIPDSLFVK